jgi:hypothetical protein
MALAACGNTSGSNRAPDNGSAGAASGASAGGRPGARGAIANGGTIANGGAITSENAGAAGSAAGSEQGHSQAEACLAYAGAVCRRQEELRGATPTDPYLCATGRADATTSEPTRAFPDFLHEEIARSGVLGLRIVK